MNQQHGRGTSSISRMLAKLTWDKGGVVSRAISESYGDIPNAASLLNMTEFEFCEKYRSHMREIEELAASERVALEGAVWRGILSGMLNWIYSLSKEGKLPEQKIEMIVRDKVYSMLLRMKG